MSGMITTSSLTEVDFIKQSLFCTKMTDEVLSFQSEEYYFKMLNVVGHSTAPSSAYQIMNSSHIMHSKFLEEINIIQMKFMNNFMNMNTYINDFEEKRFKPVINFVFNNLKSYFSSEVRFEDWEESRETWMNYNTYTTLIHHQKSLIVEFESMDKVLESISEDFGNVKIDEETMVDREQLFVHMKKVTIEYLALIFLTVYEHENDENFYTENDTVLLFWSVFHEWLDLGQCNILVHLALTNQLDKITTIEDLREALESDVEALTNPYRINPTDLKEFAGAFTEGLVFAQNFKAWSFYQEEMLTEAMDFSTANQVKERVEFDQIRFENDKNCLSFIQNFKNFNTMRRTVKLAGQYLINNHYYYFIEYLFMKMTHSPELPNKVKGKLAVQLIYIFMLQILHDDYEAIKGEEMSVTIIHIIIRIISGMGSEGHLYELVPPNFIDEETENYIKILLFIVTENNNFPKPPKSGELNRIRGKPLLDDEEDEFTRFDPRNPQFRYVIRILFKRAGKKQTQDLPYVKRYRKKFYDDQLVGENPISLEDDKFYKLEISMGRAFKLNGYNFEHENEEYQIAIREYLKLNVPNGINNPARQYAKYLLNQITVMKKKRDPKSEGYIDYFRLEYNKILLGGFSSLKSNFMQKQYVVVIMMIVGASKDLHMPDLDYLISEKVKGDDNINQFEFIKRVLTNLKHSRSKSSNIIANTVDIDTLVFQDKSNLPNGERFHAMLVDVMFYFKPKLQELSKQFSQEKSAKLQYSDLMDIVSDLNKQFHIITNDPTSKDLEEFRLMMTWNIFDDMQEYVPLLGGFMEETKSLDISGANPVKIEMLVENYTNMYIAMLEHRIFSAANNFSFENAKDRIENFQAYLMNIEEHYEDMYNQPLPDKEVRFSRLDARQVENLIYFVNFRRKVILEDDDDIVLTNYYFPYGFKEIYALSDNHPEVRSIVEQECNDIIVRFDTEKVMRASDYTAEEMGDLNERENFRFCILWAFNKDMMSLVNNQAHTNKSQNYMLTITKESIFMALIIPYYDKLTAHELLIQVFNLNMSHAKAATRETTEKFSNYIALLDSFVLILEDLEDGSNEEIDMDNFAKGEISTKLRDFCLVLEKTDEPQNKVDNLKFIRHLVLEKLQPSFHSPGANLKSIYNDYTLTADQNDAKKIKYLTNLKYGTVTVDDISGIEKNPEGDIIDTELMSLLLIYSPHSNFTSELLYMGNFMSTLPKFVKDAQSNVEYLYTLYTAARTMDDVFDASYERKMAGVRKAEKKVDTELELDLEDEYDFDLGITDELDEEHSDFTNSMWSQDIVVDDEQLDSNVSIVDKLGKAIKDKYFADTEKNSIQMEIVQIPNTTIIQDEQALKVVEGYSALATKKENMVFNGVKLQDSEDNYMEPLMSSLNMSKEHSNHETHLSVSDHNHSSMEEFEMDVMEDKISSSKNVIIDFGFKPTSNTKLTQEQMDMLKAKTLQLVQKYNPTEATVHVSENRESVDTSNRQSVRMVSHVSSKSQTFDYVNSEFNSGGEHSSVTKIVVNGHEQEIVMNSNDLDANDPEAMKLKIQKVLAEKMDNIVNKTGDNSNKKFLRLV